MGDPQKGQGGTDRVRGARLERGGQPRAMWGHPRENGDALDRAVGAPPERVGTPPGGVGTQRRGWWTPHGNLGTAPYLHPQEMWGSPWNNRGFTPGQCGDPREEWGRPGQAGRCTPRKFGEPPSTRERVHPKQWEDPTGRMEGATPNNVRTAWATPGTPKQCGDANGQCGVCTPKKHGDPPRGGVSTPKSEGTPVLALGVGEAEGTS